MKTKAEKIYEAIGEGYGFNGSREQAIKIIDTILLEETQAKNLLQSEEKAKIVATKRLKMVVDTAISEYEKAEKNGRCDECQEPLTSLEARNGKTCENCLCPA